MAEKTVSDFYNGFLFPFHSIGFIKRNPPLYKFIIMPFLINTLTFSMVVYWGFGFFQDLVMSRIPQGEAWYWLILNYFLIAVAILIVLVLVFFTFAAVGNLIDSPFNDLLSEKTEYLLTGKNDEQPFSLSVCVRDAGQVMLTEMKKISVFLFGMVVLLLLHFIPVIGTFTYPVLSICWTIFFLVMDYTGYVFFRKRLSFKIQRQTILKNASMMSGFGTGLFCVLTIPFFQFLCIPLGVVGAVRILNETGFFKQYK